MSSKLDRAAAKLHVRGARRHVLLCVRDKCCDAETAREAWKQLKQSLKAHGVAGEVLRSRVDCLGVCRAGPIAVVYPEGAWYRRASGADLERIVREHVVGGEIVKGLCFARGSLSAAGDET